MNKLINKLSDEPFAYGKNDCFTFTNALVKEWHGRDYLKLHLVYKNKKQAKEYIEKHGGIEALTIGTVGYSQKPELCVDGDAVSAEVSPGEIALGFVFKGYGFFKMKKNGVFKMPLKKCRMGWRLS